MQQMQDAALPLFFTGDEYMNTQWYSEELWHRVFPAIGNRTAWSVVAGPKESDPAVRENLHKPYSKRLKGEFSACGTSPHRSDGQPPPGAAHPFRTLPTGTWAS